MSLINIKTSYKNETLEDEPKVDVMKDVEFKEGKRLGDWTILKKIDEGEYGKIYMVLDKKTHRLAALKAESNGLEGGSALKLEAMILKKFTEEGPVPHFAQLFAAAKHDKYSYMVMKLLGPDLKQLWRKCNEKFSAGTWSRVGRQCLYAIKVLHDHGFVHRHIKPRNFLLGRPGSRHARLVHLIDFGLARQFAYYSEPCKSWHWRKRRKNVLFRGDLRYASPYAHLGREQGRFDDLWSLTFMLIEMSGIILPWHSERDFEKVKAMKRDFLQFDDLMLMPTWAMNLMECVRNVGTQGIPCYSLFCGTLLRVAFSVGNKSNEEKYDWETEEPKVKPNVVDGQIQEADWEDWHFYTSPPPIYCSKHGTLPTH